MGKLSTELYRAYNSVELDSDKFDWRKLQDVDTKLQFLDRAVQPI